MTRWAYGIISEDAAPSQLQENDLVIMVDHHAPSQSTGARLIEKAGQAHHRHRSSPPQRRVRQRTAGHLPGERGEQRL
ncbi:MAG: hypothetical protein ACLVJ6_05410 [Merdibacter sp.]